MHQSNYVKQILYELGFDECRRVSTPMDPGALLFKNQEPNNCDTDVQNLNGFSYKSIIGILSFLADRSRPDLMFSIRKLSQFSDNPSSEHWNSIKHVLRYLSNTRDFGIYLSPTDCKLVGYSDADWAGDVNDRKSFSGQVCMFGNVPISWRASKQNCVSLSSAESEYIALNECVRETLWLDSILRELNVIDQFVDVPDIYCDNRSAISLSLNRVENRSSKHIEIKYHYIREIVEQEKINLKYVATTENVADIFTKVLKRHYHVLHCINLKLDNV
jgi:hypothetical protein